MSDDFNKILRRLKTGHNPVISDLVNHAYVVKHSKQSGYLAQRRFLLGINIHMPEGDESQGYGNLVFVV